MIWLSGVLRLMVHEVDKASIRFVLLFLVQVGVGATVAWASSSGASGVSPLAAVETTATMSLYLFAHAYAGRIVSQGLSDGTSQFFDGLPLTRGQVLAAQWCLLSGMVVTTLLVVLAISMVIMPTSLLTAAVVGRLVLTTVTAGLVCAQLAWVLSFLGRYRWPAIGVLLLAAILASEVYNITLGSEAPLAVVLSLPKAVEALDLLHLPLTAGWILLGVAGGLILGGWGEGELARSWAQRMEARERGVIATVMVVALVGFGVLVDRSSNGPFILKQGFRAGEDPVVAVSTVLPDHEVFGATLHTRVQEVVGMLGIDEPLDPVNVGRRNSIRGHWWQTASTGNKDGVYIQVAPDTPGFTPEGAMAAALTRLFAERSRGRTAIADTHWFFDGLPYVLADPAPPHSSPERLACAAWGMERLPEGIVDNWYLAHDLVGDEVADAVAATMVDVVRAHGGDEGIENYARSFLQEPTPKDLRANLGEWLDPAPARFARMTGMTLDEVEGKTRDRLAELPASLLAAVAAEDTPDASVDVVADGAEWSLEVTVPQGADRRHPQLVRYTSEGVWRTGSALSSTREVVGATEGGVAVQVEDTWPTGSRVKWRAERYASALGCLLVSPWYREAL